MSLLGGVVEFFGSQKGHMVLKCSFGYFLGSLATLVFFFLSLSWGGGGGELGEFER